MKFIADAMLGKLAKRMRLLGFDVRYDPALSDNEVIRISLEERRIILTRDTGLAVRPLAKNHLLIKNDAPQKQLDQVLETFAVSSPPGPLTRCSICNDPLVITPKAEARELVPPYVYEHMESFLQCKTCGRIYWQGTHVKNMGIARAKK